MLKKKLKKLHMSWFLSDDITGGLGSPRHYLHTQNPHQMPQQPQSHPHMGHSPYASHTVQQGYDQSVQYCYDQSSLQLAYNGADRGRAPPIQGGKLKQTKNPHTILFLSKHTELFGV